RHLRTLLAVILDPTGDWRTTDIPATDATASKYLEMAKQLSASQNKASNRSAALKDYFFSMAVSRAKELSQPQASDARFELARIRIAQGRLEEAGKLLDDATKLPEDPAARQPDFDVLFMQAELNFQRNQYEESKAQFRQIIRMFPRRTE